MGMEEGILYADCNLELGVLTKLRHDFVGHYNRPDIFQVHVNRAAPRIYTVHDDNAALPPPERPAPLSPPAMQRLARPRSHARKRARARHKKR
jgi:aliphatic nitrilase